MDAPDRARRDADAPSPQFTFAVPVVLFGFLGVLALIAAVLVTTRDDSTSVASGAAPVHVSLADLSIAPSSVSASRGGGLDVTNHGAIEHNLAIEGTSLVTPMLPAGQSAHLDLSTLDPGDYQMVCLVPGHKEAGMTAALRVTAGGGLAAAGDTSSSSTAGGHASMTPEEMDKAMHDSIAAFPAKTEGLGAQLLTPTVLADGTKQFDLTTAVTRWEVSPGKFVDAMTYNGTVPGPTIRVNPGDKVRVVLHNKLPESTSIHFHGLTTPNLMDGTTYVTQDPVLSGQDFVYEFTAQSTPMVSMYHSHHNAVKQVPNGLAGAFLVGQQPVPAGVTVSQEHVMILDDSGVIGYALNGKSFPATAPYVAARDEWIEVHYMNEGTQIHPMHLHGMEQVVIAKDGFPLANPSVEDTVTVAPGERFTVLVHATVPGTWVWHCHILPHAENDDGMFGMVTALIVS